MDWKVVKMHISTIKEIARAGHYAAAAHLAKDWLPGHIAVTHYAAEFVYMLYDAASDGDRVADCMMSLAAFMIGVDVVVTDNSCYFRVDWARIASEIDPDFTEVDWLKAGVEEACEELCLTWHCDDAVLFEEDGR